MFLDIHSPYHNGRFFVTGTDIVQREIDIGSTVGNKIQEMLMKGEALPSEFVIQMLK